jgi:hypothetical protein
LTSGNGSDIIDIERNEREVITMTMLYGDKDTIVLEQTCPFCRQKYQGVFVTSEFDAWQNGELIQNAMPLTPATSREWLISGICPDCQESIFGEEE